MAEPDNVARIIGAFAATVALVNVGVSIYNSRRDSARVKATSHFYGASEYGEAYVTITIVNAGRRAVLLRYLYFGDGPSNYIGTAFEGGKPELRLGEHERHELRIYNRDLVQDTPEDDIKVETIWFEDTLGRKYQIKGLDKNIERLAAAANDYSRSDG